MFPAQFSKPLSRMFVPTGTKEHLIVQAGSLLTANIRNGFSATTNFEANSSRQDFGTNTSDYTSSVCCTEFIILWWVKQIDREELSCVIYMHCFLSTVKSSSAHAATGECNTFLPAVLGAEGSNMSSSKAVASGGKWNVTGGWERSISYTVKHTSKEPSKISWNVY